MKYDIFFLVVMIIFNTAYMTVLYALYKPNKEKYIKLECKSVNDTYSFATLNKLEFHTKCPSLFFIDIKIDGDCYLDTANLILTEFDVTWYPLLTITGVLAGSSILAFIMRIIVRLIL